MEFDLVATVVAGLVGTAVITAVMAMSPLMGMPKMDIPAMLGSMFGAPGSRALGMVLHFMMGVVFAIIYAVLFSPFTGTSILLLGVVFGIGHWLIVGATMGMMPAMHAGMRSGQVATPGFYMLQAGGALSFIGGLMGHLIFGLVVALVYGLLVGGFGA